VSERRKISREAFEAEFFPGAERIAPGIWVDRKGHVHVSVPELLEFFDIEDTPENRAEVTVIVEESLAAAAPDATIIRHDPVAH
jgi:hypothetical protein